MRRLAVAVWLGLVLAPPPAWGGDFCGSLDGPGVLRLLERYASGKPGEAFNVDCIAQSFGDPLTGEPLERVDRACTRALALPRERRRADVDGYCVHRLANAGIARSGARDLVAELMAFGGDWDAPPAYETLAATGDPRVRPFILAAIARHRATWARHERRPGWARDHWARHRVRALRALEALGVAEDVALIDTLAAEKPADRRVTAAARRARAAAAARRAP